VRAYISGGVRSKRGSLYRGRGGDKSIIGVNVNKGRAQRALGEDWKEH